MLGTGALSLPQRLSSMGYGQAFFPLFLGLIASISLWPMVWINSKYESKNLFEINEILLGKWLGKCINFLIVAQFTVFTSTLIIHYMDLIQSTALHEKTMTWPVILFLLLLAYIVSGDIKFIARFCVMVFFLTLPLYLLLRWGIQKGEISHVFPLFNYNWHEFFSALKKGYSSFLGYELIMIFFPYIASPKKAYKHALIGIWISVTFFFVTVLVSVMYYSEWQLKNVEYSVLHLFKAGEIAFISRIDIFGITLWVFLILSTVAGYLWSAKKGLDSVRSKHKNYHIYLLVIAIFIIIILPVSSENRERISVSVHYSAYLLVVWPMILGVLHLLRKKLKVRQQ